MLLKLEPDHVAEHWDEIKPAIESSLPPAASPNMNEVLASILVGRLKCWASYEKTENGSVIEGIMTTAVIEDFISGTLSLLIYSFYSYRKLRARAWLEGHEALSKYARSLGCEWIIGYSDVNYLADMAKKLGGDASFRMLRYPLKEDRHGK